jgi:RHS repeat-associated protein
MNSSSPNSVYKYNGKELDTERGINYGYYGHRYYSMFEGRWITVDPLADEYLSHSPYNYALNDPIGKKDPDGRFVWGAAIGAVVELGSQITVSMAVKNMSFGEAISNVDLADVGVAAGVGLMTGGLSSLKSVGTLAKIGISAAGDAAEGAIKANVGEGPPSEYTIENGVLDASVAIVAGSIGEVGKEVAQMTGKAKELNKTAQKSENVANKGRPREAQTKRAAAARKAAQTYGEGNVATTVNESTKEATGQFVNSGKEEEK